MRKIISFMHISLAGFVAGPNGEMDWIKVDEEIFDFSSAPGLALQPVPAYRQGGNIIE